MVRAGAGVFEFRLSNLQSLSGLVRTREPKCLLRRVGKWNGDKRISYYSLGGQLLHPWHFTFSILFLVLAFAVR